MTDDELFWTIFGAIGTTIGSIATAAAVVVALWQAKFSTKKKLKLHFNDPITIVDPNSGKSIGDYIGVTITNIGNREVIISDWSIICSNGKKNNRYKIMTELQGILKKTLPYRLPIEESLDLSYERKYFVSGVCNMIEKQEINPNKKLKFQIMDTTGKEYIVYSKLIASVYASEHTGNKI